MGYNKLTPIRLTDGSYDLMFGTFGEEKKPENVAESFKPVELDETLPEGEAMAEYIAENKEFVKEQLPKEYPEEDFEEKFQDMKEYWLEE